MKKKNIFLITLILLMIIFIILGLLFHSINNKTSDTARSILFYKKVLYTYITQNQNNIETLFINEDCFINLNTAEKLTDKQIADIISYCKDFNINLQLVEKNYLFENLNCSGIEINFNNYNINNTNFTVKEIHQGHSFTTYLYESDFSNNEWNIHITGMSENL